MVQIESHKKKGVGTLAVRDVFASCCKSLFGIVLASKAEGGFVDRPSSNSLFTSRLPCHA